MASIALAPRLEKPLDASLRRQKNVLAEAVVSDSRRQFVGQSWRERGSQLCEIRPTVATAVA
jgi:hypothetical protein